jgi:dienelactone hydrolase
LNRRAFTLATSLLFGLAALLAGSSACRAKLVEQVVALPVQVVAIRGQTISQTITLTIFRDDARGRSPFLILNHGRPVHVGDHAKMGRIRYSANAAYFVALGFAVFVPTRIGYGVSGGPDIEDSGSCRGKDYPPSYEAAAQESLAVIAYAKSRSYVDGMQGIALGQSFGGMTAMAVAAKNPPGVIAAVNFAGGGGGNPETHPERPCANDRLTDLFTSYGATARIPTLWLYSENDRYFGTEKPRAWLEAFIARGGAGRFVRLPPSGDNGHSSFTANPNGWHKPFEDFVASLGLRWAAPPSGDQD